MQKPSVRLAFGLDNFGSTLAPEIDYFAGNKTFDNLTILKIATEDTPQTIFPNRRIGQLHEGFEASFLVLAVNLLTDFKQIKNIVKCVGKALFCSKSRDTNKQTANYFYI